MASELPTTGSTLPTEGSGEGGYVAVEVQGSAGKFPSNVETQKDVSSKGSTAWDFANNPGKLFESVKEHFPTVAIIVSLVGYVLIAAFGHSGMSIGGFVMYLTFLIFLYLSNGLLAAPIAVQEGFRSLNRLFVMGFFALLLVVFLQNKNLILKGWLEVSSFLSSFSQLQSSANVEPEVKVK